MLIFDIYSKLHFILKMSKKSIEDKKQQKILKQYLNDIKEKSCCVKCGENRPWVLDFHHIKPKRMSIPEMARTSCTIEDLQHEIDKCIIVCANCHRDIHHQLNMKNEKNT